MNNIFYLVPAFGILALLYTVIKSSWVSKQDAGNDRMKEIGQVYSRWCMAILKSRVHSTACFLCSNSSFAIGPDGL